MIRAKLCLYFFCRLNNYGTYLKDLKSRRDPLYRRLEKLLLEKVVEFFYMDFCEELR